MINESVEHWPGLARSALVRVKAYVVTWTPEFLNNAILCRQRGTSAFQSLGGATVAEGATV